MLMISMNLTRTMTMTMTRKKRTDESEKSLCGVKLTHFRHAMINIYDWVIVPSRWVAFSFWKFFWSFSYFYFFLLFFLTTFRFFVFLGWKDNFFSIENSQKFRIENLCFNLINWLKLLKFTFNPVNEWPEVNFLCFCVKCCSWNEIEFEYVWLRWLSF